MADTWRELLEEGSVRVPGAIRFSGLGRSALYEAMANGELAFFKVGAARLIPRRALIEFLASAARTTGTANSGQVSTSAKS
jgi:excisionase family DNA binding protein